jgi:biotin-dependent carboxylase-like uncharacterized protein
MTAHHEPSRALFRVIHAGAMTSLQDGGRIGLKQYGIPPGGAMDLHAIERLNRLFEHTLHTAAWEMLWASLHAECMSECCIAYAGDAQGYLNESPFPAERTTVVRRGDRLRFAARGQSLWTYLSVGGGWQGPQWFGSQSSWPDGGMGRYLSDGDVLYSAASSPWRLPDGISARFLRTEDKGGENALFRVFAGPQWQDFPDSSRSQFFSSDWRISQQSNRAGFRLQGPTLIVPPGQLLSEPTVLGSIQVPASGQPIVLLNDGPTVGGYAKIAVLHPDDLDRFRQSPSGRTLSFTLIS